MSLFVILAVAICQPVQAGTNLNLRNHVSVAQEVDQIIEQELRKNKRQVAQTASDADFLRRVTLDLAGRIPSVNEVTLFGLDPDPQKRDKLIKKLIDSEDFAENWSAYWSDVMYSRATDTRARAFERVFENWLKEKIASNESWDKITTEIITATGNVRENGATGLMFAHQGDPKEIVAEVSRIFMGIQIQCANCHDHPTDTWTRDQFHQMAAFFPRVRVRPVRSEGPRSFEIVSVDRAGRNPRDFLNNPGRILERFDTNKDGKLTKKEVKGAPQLARVFDRLLEFGDTNKDQALSAEELKNLPQPGGNRNRSTEYYMPNLENPSEKGTLMHPVFFVNEVEAGENLTDMERRTVLAKYVTDTENPWFAKAFVNRIWTEMLGQGFYSPVDDMGPLRDAQHEAAIELLSQAFIANQYDTKWLFRSIANTAAYQRKMLNPGSGEAIDEPIAFACATPTRLRSDQIFDSLMELAAIKVENGNGRVRRPGGRNNPKAQFSTLFGYDPSTPQDDLMGTIPQSLFMMNSGIIEQLISSRGNGPLARITRKYSDDAEAISELYLLVFSRTPSQNEMKICKEYIKQSDTRNEALEDVMWALVNSSEFISKR